MSLTLDSGSMLQRSAQTGQWSIVDPGGSSVPVHDAPWLALLLVEREPKETMPLLPGFPFQLVIDYALRSRLTRYIAGALKWSRALAEAKVVMPECRFVKAWIGRCGKSVTNENGQCDVHQERCAEGHLVTAECGEVIGPFVCGMPVCESECHKHGRNG